MIVGVCCGKDNEMCVFGPSPQCMWWFVFGRRVEEALTDHGNPFRFMSIISGCCRFSASLATRIITIIRTITTAAESEHPPTKANAGFGTAGRDMHDR